MRSSFVLLPALAVALLVLVGGCGQPTTSVKPSDLPSESGYEEEFQEEVGLDGRPAKKKPASSDVDSADKSGGEGESK